jgi:hypothetical protein
MDERALLKRVELRSHVALDDRGQREVHVVAAEQDVIADRDARELELMVNYGMSATDALKPGRLRLCPYYFVIGGKTRLSGALATFCPPDKKIIHGMTDGIFAPCSA